jgi:hypothetical protein
MFKKKQHGPVTVFKMGRSLGKTMRTFYSGAVKPEYRG